MSRIDELHNDLHEKIDLNKASAGLAPPPPAPDFIDQILAASPFPAPKDSQSSSRNGARPALPPAMEGLRGHTVDEVYKMINRTPLFMTTLDETDGEGGENVELEAIKALMHEGTTAEVAGNFRDQGNEQARAKRWRDAKAFYDQALTALKNPNRKFEAEEGATNLDVVEIDEKAEEKKERQLEEACYVNRALCNLELSMYKHYVLFRTCSNHMAQRIIALARLTALRSFVSTHKMSKPFSDHPPHASRLIKYLRQKTLVCTVWPSSRKMLHSRSSATRYKRGKPILLIWRPRDVNVQNGLRQRSSH
jgi:hypothetical protein